MRKLAILLGTLAIAASAFAGGKEPVAPEVTTVVKETVVYKSAKRGGFVDVSYRWNGVGTHFSEDGYKWDGGNGYNAPNGAGRLQILGALPLTEKDTFEFRVRVDNALEKYTAFGDAADAYNTSSGGAQVRFRYTHKHDFLNASSRLQYRNTGADGYGWASAGNALEYRFQIPIEALYLDNDFIKTTKFVVAPKVGYAWAYADKGSATTLWYGIDLETVHQLPLGFSFEFDIWAGNYTANDKYFYAGEKSNIGVFFYAVLSNSITLVEWDSAKLSFAFDGGLDSYKYSQRKGATGTFVTTSGTDVNKAYYAFVNPYFKLDYQATEDLNFYIAAGVEYGNGDIQNASEAQKWALSPTAWAGFRYSF
jgi:hypothetical protein